MPHPFPRAVLPVSSSVIRDLLHLMACLATAILTTQGIDYADPHPFGTATAYARIADTTAIGTWWKPEAGEKHQEMRRWFRTRPRDQTLAFGGRRVAVTRQDDGDCCTATASSVGPSTPRSMPRSLHRERRR